MASFFERKRYLSGLRSHYNCRSLSSPTKGQSIQDNKRTSTTSFGIDSNLQGFSSTKNFSRETRIDCLALQHPRTYIRRLQVIAALVRLFLLLHWMIPSDCTASSATQGQSIQDNKQTSMTSFVDWFNLRSSLSI